MDQGGKGFSGVPNQVLSSPRLHIFPFVPMYPVAVGTRGGCSQEDPGSRSWALGVGGFAGSGVVGLAVVVNSRGSCPQGCRQGLRAESGALGKGYLRLCELCSPHSLAC